MQVARQLALDLMEKDPMLEKPENVTVRQTVLQLRSKYKDWGRIS